MTNQSKSMSLIHISDLHCTASAHTLGQISGGLLHRDYQNSSVKTDLIASYLISNRQTLGSSTVIISGDLTDSGDEEDYTDPNNGVLRLLNRLRGAGFAVFVIPGNHDYCKEGNQFLTGQINEGEQARRQRFLRLATPQYASSPKYPHVEALKRPDGSLGARLILLDSMEGELDGDTDNHRAQGTLGDAQLQALSALLTQFQAERAQGIKIVVALHHSPFYDDGDLKLSDAAKFRAIIQGHVDCLLFGHTTRDARYQAPRYVAPLRYEPEDSSLVEAQSSLGIPLINVENLEYMGGTLPVAVLDLDNNTRSVHYIKRYVLTLHKVVCNQPATSLGDDLQIYVDNNPVTPAILLDIGHGSVVDVTEAVVDSAIQSIENLFAGPRDELKIDKGQTHAFDPAEAEFGVSDQIDLVFFEDGDPAGSVKIASESVAGKGTQVLPVKIKNDGRYDLYYSVVKLADEYSAGAGGAKLIETAFDLGGTWTDGARDIPISRVFNALTIDMSAFHRSNAFGNVVDRTTIAVTFPDGGVYTGKLSGSDTIVWSNHSSWKKRKDRPMDISTLFALDGFWTDGSPRRIAITRAGNSLAADMSAFGRAAAHGSVVDPTTISMTFTDAGTYIGKLLAPGTIVWSNSSSWRKA